MLFTKNIIICEIPVTDELTMFLKMIPPVVSNYYLKIFLDQIVIETYLYMNCFLIRICVSEFVYH